ncbi:MAG: YfcC family protein [Clostridiales bacterium]
MSVEKKEKKRIRIPHTFVFLFFLAMLAAILTWVLPHGQYQYEKVDVNGTMRNLVVPGTYEIVEEGKKAGVVDFFGSFHKGLIAAADVVMLIFLVNGAFSMIIKTGAFNALLATLLRRFEGKDKILVPLMFLVFAFCGSMFGMLNEFNGFYPIFVGIGIALGYDALFGMAIVGLGAYIGFAGSIMNPYTVVVAQGIAGVPIYSNTWFRVLSFVVFCAISIIWLLRYGSKVKKNPLYSFVTREDLTIDLEGGTDRDELVNIKMTGKHKIILTVVLLAMAWIIYGSVKQGWGMIQLTGVFLLMGIAAAVIDGWSPDNIAKEFIDGAKSVAFGALVTGIARATLVLLQEGMIVDTIINGLVSNLEGLPPILAVQGMLVIQTLFNFIIPSGSGQAATTIPILAPMGDILGLTREAVVMAFQYGATMADLLWPTCGITVVCGLSGIPYDKWLKFFIPLFGILYVSQMALLAILVMLGI